MVPLRVVPVLVPVFVPVLVPMLVPVPVLVPAPSLPGALRWSRLHSPKERARGERREGGEEGEDGGTG